MNLKRKIRVLIVDDSTVIRRLLSTVLGEDSDIEVVATAPNGRIAIAKLTQVNPDIVTLDMQMPEMDGIQTLIEIRKSHASLPVIMFSALTQRGAESTIDALAHGANDYVSKPANLGSDNDPTQSIRQEMIPKIKSLCEWFSQSNAPKPAETIAPEQRFVQRYRQAKSNAPQRIEVVAVGVSTGGPNALAKLLTHLPRDFAVPIVLVQHMPPEFTKLLADRLDQNCSLRVVEAAAGDVLKPGHVYIAPGDYHMVLEKNALVTSVKLNQDALENSCRPAVDVLFRSVAKHYGPSALAVVLTGMGQDGLLGCRCIRDAGGEVITQDQATSVVWGMPGAVSNAGLANAILPLENIADELMRRVSVGRMSRSRNGDAS